ncbi:MAG: HD domain-containing protein [Gemmatimonadaceae bacterium]|nr:HD domain-containing protein [Gemmatimonadaceae bacterium]
MTGYSDRINHALAFAAKHHDQQVRKGTRPPYVTRAANVAVILASYGCPEETVVAAILHDAVEDYSLAGWTRAMLEERIADKFGIGALETAYAVARRRTGRDGAELDRSERNADLLSRVGDASDESRWILAANHVHTGNSLLADLRRTVDAASVWSRSTGGHATFAAWHRSVLDALAASGFQARIMEELRRSVESLEDSPPGI